MKIVCFVLFVFVSISILCPKVSDISLSISRRSVFFTLGLNDLFFLLLDKVKLSSLIEIDSFAIFFAIISASLGVNEASNFACPFSIIPFDSISKTDWGKDRILKELAMVLLAFPVDVATSSCVRPNSLLSLSNPFAS